MNTFSPLQADTAPGAVDTAQEGTVMLGTDSKTTGTAPHREGMVETLAVERDMEAMVVDTTIDTR